jgi:outer membrane protein OmpA-like peptidoglycan-associated protein
MQLSRHAVPAHGPCHTMSLIRRSRPLLAAAGLLICTASVAWSQEDTIYIGGSAPRGGSVQVDMSVLNDLSAKSGANVGANPIVLTPPGHKKTAKAASSHHRTAKAKPATRKAPAPRPKATTSATPVKAATPAPRPATPAPVTPKQAALPDLPPPPPEPVDITMPSAAPTPVAPKAMAAAAATATTVAAHIPDTTSATPSALPRDIKPAPSPAPAVAAKEPAAKEPATKEPAVKDVAATEPVANTAPSEPEPTPAVEMSPMAAAAATAPLSATKSTPASSDAPHPTSESAPQPTPETMQTAALKTAPQSSNTAKQSIRIPFSGAAATLPEDSKGDLKVIAGSLSKDPALRVQVMAYASGNNDASRARRLSLSRALAVRGFLIDQGVGSTRIDVRALGNTAEGGPSDRVDLMVLSR